MKEQEIERHKSWKAAKAAEGKVQEAEAPPKPKAEAPQAAVQENKKGEHPDWDNYWKEDPAKAEENEKKPLENAWKSYWGATQEAQATPATKAQTSEKDELVEAKKEAQAARQAAQDAQVQMQQMMAKMQEMLKAQDQAKAV